MGRPERRMARCHSRIMFQVRDEADFRPLVYCSRTLVLGDLGRRAASSCRPKPSVVGCWLSVVFAGAETSDTRFGAAKPTGGKEWPQAVAVPSRQSAVTEAAYARSRSAAGTPG